MSHGAAKLSVLKRGKLECCTGLVSKARPATVPLDIHITRPGPDLGLARLRGSSLRFGHVPPCKWARPIFIS